MLLVVVLKVENLNEVEGIMIRSLWPKVPSQKVPEKTENRSFMHKIFHVDLSADLQSCSLFFS